MSQPGRSEGPDSAAEALLVASRALIAVAARSLADTAEVTLVQYRALVVLSRSNGVTVGDLAAALDVHPSTATRLCDRLAAKALIRRRAGAGVDRRATALNLTAKGRRLVEHVIDRRRRDLAAICARMSPTEQAAAVAGLEAFGRAAGQIDGGDPFGWPDSNPPSAAPR
jgi:DNA-binding MarR family transcriptional regulator